MNKFNKKSLCVALAATGLLGAAGVAQAVNLSEDGTGNVLIFPYYTVNTTAAGNAANTYINITNTTGSTKAVKVRFLEGRNSREVLDFNVFLSPFDMWTGAVVPAACVTGTDACNGAALVTADRSCTIPSFTFQAGASVSDQVAFRTIKFAGANADGGGEGYERTKEGYAEVLEMATYGKGIIAAGALHDQTTGRPKDCSVVVDAVAASEAESVNGGLMGTLQLINPGAGASMSVNAVALDNFYPDAPGGFKIYSDTGSPNPNMRDSGLTSAVKYGNQLVVSQDWDLNSADAVSAVLMHKSIMNEYILDKGTLSKTDWVVTMPTKSAYVDVGTGDARAPFQSNFNPATGKSCDDAALLLWDREERFYTAKAGGPDFSPRPPGPNPNIPTLCYEANVITFNSGAVLASNNQTLDISTKLSDTAGDNAENGWMQMTFPSVTGKPLAHTLGNSNTTFVSLTDGVATSTGVEATYSGLPVVGFNVWTYTNSALKVGSVVAITPTNYGMGVPHKSKTEIFEP